MKKRATEGRNKRIFMCIKAILQLNKANYRGEVIFK